MPAGSSQAKGPLVKSRVLLLPWTCVLSTLYVPKLGQFRPRLPRHRLATRLLACSIAAAMHVGCPGAWAATAWG